MGSTVCTCVWLPRPQLFGFTWHHAVVDPDCTATHPDQRCA